MKQLEVHEVSQESMGFSKGLFGFKTQSVFIGL